MIDTEVSVLGRVLEQWAGRRGGIACVTQVAVPGSRDDEQDSHDHGRAMDGHQGGRTDRATVRSGRTRRRTPRLRLSSGGGGTPRTTPGFQAAKATVLTPSSPWGRSVAELGRPPEQREPVGDRVVEAEDGAERHVPPLLGRPSLPQRHREPGGSQARQNPDRQAGSGPAGPTPRGQTWSPARGCRVARAAVVPSRQRQVVEHLIEAMPDQVLPHHPVVGRGADPRRGLRRTGPGGCRPDPGPRRR